MQPITRHVVTDSARGRIVARNVTNCDVAIRDHPNELHRRTIIDDRYRADIGVAHDLRCT
jgi:hypothetical protein